MPLAVVFAPPGGVGSRAIVQGQPFIIMYIKIKKAELSPDKFGNFIKITMIGLYDDNGKWIKWVK